MNNYLTFTFTVIVKSDMLFVKVGALRLSVLAKTVVTVKVALRVIGHVVTATNLQNNSR